MFTPVYLFNSLTRTNALMRCHVNSCFWRQRIYALLQQSSSCDCLLLDSKCTMASRKRKALPSSDANFILRLLDEESSGDDSDTSFLYSSESEDDEESIHQPTSSFQSYTQLPVPLDQPTTSFQNTKELSPSRELPISSFQSYSTTISCSHPSTAAVAFTLPPTSSVTTSSSQLILHNTLLTTSGSTPLITNSLTQSSPPPLPPPILSFISSHSTSCPTAGATPLMSVTPTSSTAAYTSTISHSSMNYTVQFCYFKTFCNRYDR